MFPSSSNSKVEVSFWTQGDLGVEVLPGPRPSLVPDCGEAQIRGLINFCAISHYRAFSERRLILFRKPAGPSPTPSTEAQWPTLSRKPTRLYIDSHSRRGSQTQTPEGSERRSRPPGRPQPAGPMLCLPVEDVQRLG